MTTENLNLLYKDLCARLPYGVKVKLLCCGPEPKFDDWIEVTLNTKDIELFGKSFKNIKPYLRPMSSMTEEECITLSKLIPYEMDAWKYVKTPVPLYIANIEQFDFFHRHHLDWRGLIPKGLALEAPEGMYKID